MAPFDLLADLGGDIFATPQSAPPYFANFAQFNSHTGKVLFTGYVICDVVTLSDRGIS